MEHSLLKAAGGSLGHAVEAIHAFLRLLVERWRALDDAKPLSVMGHEILAVWSGPGASQIDVQISRTLSEIWLRELDESGLSVDRDLSFPRIWKSLLPGSASEQDVKYYFMRSIRRRYGLAPSATTARHLHAIAGRVAPLAERHSESPVSYEEFFRTVQRAIEPEASREGAEPDSAVPDPAQAYCDLCWALERVRPAGRGQITLEAEAADAEHLMSHLFRCAHRDSRF